MIRNSRALRSGRVKNIAERKRNLGPDLSWKTNVPSKYAPQIPEKYQEVSATERALTETSFRKENKALYRNKVTDAEQRESILIDRMAMGTVVTGEGKYSKATQAIARMRESGRPTTVAEVANIDPVEVAILKPAGKSKFKKLSELLKSNQRRTALDRATQADMAAGVINDPSSQAIEDFDAAASYLRNTGMLRQGEGAGIDPAEAAKAAEQLQARAPDLDYYPTPESVPPELMQQLLAENPDATPQTIKGARVNGRTLIVGANHTSVSDMLETFWHEDLGHKKLEGLLGEAKLRELAQPIDSRDAAGELADALRLSDDAKQGVLSAYDSQSDAGNASLQALREVFGYTAQFNANPSMMQKWRQFMLAVFGAVRNAIRDASRAMGFDPAKVPFLSKLGASDIYYFLKKASNEPARFSDNFASALRKDNTPKQVQAAINKIAPKEPTGLNILKGFGRDFRMLAVDRFDFWEQLGEKMGDSLKALQMMYYLRMSDRVSNMTMETLTNGAPKIVESVRKDGNKQYLVESGGGVNIQDIVNILRDDGPKALDNWAAWMRVLRAEKVGYDKMGLELSQDERNTILAYGNNNPRFQEARRLYNAYNNGLLDFAVQAGALSAKAADKMRNLDYFSYYRQGDNFFIDSEHVFEIGNLKDVPELARLVGSERSFVDPMEAIAINTRTLLRMSLNNVAAKNAAHTLNELKLGNFVKHRPKEDSRGALIPEDKASQQGRNILHFREHGQARHFIVDTSTNPNYADIPAEMLVKGMEGIATTMPNLLRMMAVPARVLRFLITHNPIYPLRQLLRDPVSAWMTTGTDGKIVTGAFKEFARVMRNGSSGQEVMQRRGITGGQMISGMDSEDLGEAIRQLHKGQGGMAKIFAVLGEMGLAADAATRIRLYENFRSKGMEDLESTVATMQAINFSSRGLSPTATTLNMLIPFFNAQIQSLDVLAKAMRNKMPFSERLEVRKKFIQRGLMLAAGTMLYAMMMSDDEGYKKATVQQRLSNWFIPNPFAKEHIRIPIPFEVGLIFKALPEAVMIAMSDDPQAKQLKSALISQMINIVPGGSSMLMPAAVKPMFEAMTNYNAFTGKTVVPTSLKDVPAEMQFDRSTQEITKEVAGALGLSPIKVEHVLRGYTGPLGYSLLQVLNNLLYGSQRPAGRLTDTPFVGALFQPIDGGGLIGAAYEGIDKVKGQATVVKRSLEQGEKPDAETVRVGSFGAAASSMKSKLDKISQLENRIRFSKQLTPEQKREQLDKLREVKSRMSLSVATAIAPAL